MDVNSETSLWTSSVSLLFLQVALWTLGQQVASTGYVVEPYRKYPSLLEVLLNFLKTEQNQGIRREVCMGGLHHSLLFLNGGIQSKETKLYL